jgi:HD superfamily phosphohydrolase
MQWLNKELDGKLQMAIDIFTGTYPKKFLHQLVSGQLDVDRMDYLTRDSFFSGVSEGVIGHDRILKMLVVHNGELMVEEKAIYSIEKFLVARRLMYWQVYLHKTVLVAEKMLINTIKRVKQIYSVDQESLKTGTSIDYFLGDYNGVMDDKGISQFCSLDDFDMIHALKVWGKQPDTILSTLCNGLLNRKLLKIKLQAEPFSQEVVQQKCKSVCHHLNISEADAEYLVFTGNAANTMYKINDERINILFKGGEVKDISEVDNALIHKTMATPIKKFYICYYE